MRNCRAHQPLCQINEPTKYFSDSLFLDPTETKKATASISYGAKGQEYLYVVFTHIPQKEVCRDVIKYKTVCNTITKYRIEEKCETKYKTIKKCD